MSSLIDIQDPGDLIYTSNAGQLRAFVVIDTGDLIEVQPEPALAGRIAPIGGE